MSALGAVAHVELCVMKRSADELALDIGGFSNKGPKMQFSEADIAAQIAAARASLNADMTQPKSKEKRPTAEVQPAKEVKVSKEMIEPLMTGEHRKLMTEATGAVVEWNPQRARVILNGSAEQINQAVRLVSKIQLHCSWGVTEDKVRRILKKPLVDSVLCRLAPMTMNKLAVVEKTLSAGQATKFSIGKDRSCDVVIDDHAVSRAHCVISFDPAKGAVYILDVSTNGTYLNGKLLSKKWGRVLLSHGDEILLKKPSSHQEDFGYICNLKEISVRAEPELKHLRKPTAEESNLPGSR